MTVTLWQDSKHTVSSVPSGYVNEAAVYPSGSNGTPLAVKLPANSWP